MGKGEEIPKTNPAEIEAVIARVKQSNIEQRDVELIERLLRTVMVLVKLLERKNISIKKLREMIFGRRTEKRRKGSGAVGEKSGEVEEADQEGGRRAGGEAGNVERSSSKSADKPVKGGHGRRAAAAYVGAKIVRCQHQELKAGGRCPDPLCGGRLYDLNEPKVMLQFTGRPLIEATNYERE